MLEARKYKVQAAGHQFLHVFIASFMFIYYGFNISSTYTLSAFYNLYVRISSYFKETRRSNHTFQLHLTGSMSLRFENGEHLLANRSKISNPSIQISEIGSSRPL